jgi:hypothetical protein
MVSISITKFRENLAVHQCLKWVQTTNIKFCLHGLFIFFLMIDKISDDYFPKADLAL